MIERIFTGCDQPLLPALLDHLWSGADDEFIDWSQRVLILPTRNVGRRVREGLARRAQENGRAILSPKILTPGSLFSSLIEESRRISTAHRTLLCAEAIQGAPEDWITRAFGRAPTGSTEELLGLARFFLETRSTLGEALLDYEKVSKGEATGDSDRWRALSALESRYRDLLANHGQEDPDDIAAQLAGEPADCFGGRSIVMAGTPDFPERVAVFLRKLAEDLPVKILILAREELANSFDDVGRPRVDTFTNAPIPIPDSCLHASKDVHEANRSIADRLTQFPESRSACVCGVGLPANGAALAFELRTKGIAAHDPAGTSFGATAAGRFFQQLTAVCYGDEIADLSAWFRDPFVAHWMQASDEPLSREDWIHRCDLRMEEILPNSINDFLRLASRGNLRIKVIGLTLQLRREAQKSGSIFALLENPSLRPLLSTVEEEPGVADFATALNDIRETAERSAKWANPASLGRWAVEEAMKFSLYGERPPDSVEVLGWLELLWEESPWLQIPDFYDGSVPGAIGTHPLLPDTLRQELNLSHRAKRDARDAYILRTLYELRQVDGKLDLHVPQRDLGGQAVSPSRLLYFVSEKELPARVKLLSEEAPAQARTEAAPKVHYEPSKNHSPEDWLGDLKRIHVTSFSSWIRCPYTFYLERVAGFSTMDPDRLEMNPQAFGTAIHEVLRRMDDELSGQISWNDPDKLAGEAKELLDVWFLDRYGKRPGLLLELQREGLRRRIVAAAGFRYQARQEGWRPLHVEWNFREEDLIKIEGIPLSGQIDLVEERDNELRVVDYKTSDTPTHPFEAHTTPLNRKRSFTPSQLLPVHEGQELGWTNLQLPLYALAVQCKYPDKKVRVAYGLLPKAVTESQLSEWPDFTEALSESALKAAETVVSLWRQKGFWPPSANFRQTDANSWSGAEGPATWLRGDLYDLSEIDSGDEGGAQ